MYSCGACGLTLASWLGRKYRFRRDWSHINESLLIFCIHICAKHRCHKVLLPQQMSHVEKILSSRQSCGLPVRLSERDAVDIPQCSLKPKAVFLSRQTSISLLA